MLNKPVQLHHQPRRVYTQRYRKIHQAKTRTDSPGFRTLLSERFVDISARWALGFRTLGSTGLYARLGFYAQPQLRTLRKNFAANLMVEDVSINYCLKVTVLFGFSTFIRAVLFFCRSVFFVLLSVLFLPVFFRGFRAGVLPATASKLSSFCSGGWCLL
jgi:hypothetical protein